MLLKYEVRVFDFENNCIYCEDFKSLNLAVRACNCFNSDFVYVELENLLTERLFPVEALIEVMKPC